MNADTIFRVGSITKVITNLMLFKLADEGKIHLDDPISVTSPPRPSYASFPWSFLTDSVVQKYVPQLNWKSAYKNNPGITWRVLAGQVR